ncbi:hypothetical protein FQZ97_969270 [compost metagenome]
MHPDEDRHATLFERSEVEGSAEETRRALVAAVDAANGAPEVLEMLREAIAQTM